MDPATELVELPVQRVAVVCARLTTQEIPGFIGPAFGEIIGALGRQGLAPAGPPFGRYRSLDDGSFDVEAGFPCSGRVTPEGRVEPGELPGGLVARTRYVGPYEGIAEAYGAATSWLAQAGYRVRETPWECYLDGPEVAQPRTEVFMPCAPAAPPDHSEGP
ncbi:effector-binding domain-containing protein [Georgenia soli]|uniref:Effector-binding domain-containing protein n=1 Tax=Georgenia soli TaxID=638953 RepID=A0A2A9EJ65_9MICO|nr:GyrI-like domain-containing protein [Georgenia soli]PFG38290.1 effector-binding domain-containing protein [Georgenia soli]